MLRWSVAAASMAMLMLVGAGVFGLRPSADADQRRDVSYGWRDDAAVLADDSADRVAGEECSTSQRISDSTFWFAREVRRAVAVRATSGDSLT